ncbi:CRISPR system precrRNA processing endoribonuclease RAMP protein Cas6 [Gordonia sp. NPDC062954]|uniref:CRISPR system precrRNA processing endoribonuclease RAMP protein Cas6 n=1 Tax=Gordonia sp. NPDC062954 TaxID=3364003 RepID=UPI0037C8192B
MISVWMDGAEQHHDTRKPWSITPMTRIDGVDAIHVVSLSESANVAIGSRALARTQVRLGSQVGQFLGDPVALEFATARDLAAEPVEEAHCIRFFTPTTLKDGNRSSPLLEPIRLARSTVSRWNSLFADPADHLDITDAQGVWVSDLDGRNEVVKLHSTTVSGFVGRMRFVCTTEESARLFSRLWAFAEHAGVGAYTAAGMGCVLREPTWQPRRSR